jgi:hypothetical protein
MSLKLHLAPRALRAGLTSGAATRLRGLDFILINRIFKLSLT